MINPLAAPDAFKKRRFLIAHCRLVSDHEPRSVRDRDHVDYTAWRARVIGHFGEQKRPRISPGPVAAGISFAT
jgi:hypothetical protein